uniref:NADH-ubiquinone oxidoreductase chain 3 n=1 Tax=Halosydna sp. YZ-2018 TaxID=2153331 RepID=A0A343W6A2_9ANNE|nr:NADH dehydrogenase subunit 3 [Harmothoe imbricata]AVW86124.1 NADH dehydrogenase subunit 3 [Halosydna sp. YZ-2018]WKB17964.1 NADH dehydrogenase subunit 3 [Harmothoe imbricata]
MLLSLLSLSIALILPMVVLSIALIISFRSSEDREKCSPFECGFDPKNTARIPFSLRFFLLAVIFLVFDIEIVLLMPAPILLNSISSPNEIFTLLLFFLILILGLLHEWHEGSLDWTS